MAAPSVAYRFVASKLPVLELESNHARCGRCGRVREVNGSRPGSGYCGDCLPFAVKDGWTKINRGTQTTQPTQEEQ